MTLTHDHTAQDPEDTGTNPSSRPHLSAMIERRLSRRAALVGSMAVGVGFFNPGLVGSAAADPRAKASRSARSPLLGFEPLPLGYGDEVVVPEGYRAQVLIPWGTPITGSYPAFRPGQNTAEEVAQQVGQDHDGMFYFPIGGSSTHGLLVLNHEVSDERTLQTGTTRSLPAAQRSAETVRRSQAAHGVSVVEVRRTAVGAWEVVRGGHNRRITATTPMAFSGPAAGHRLVQTASDRAGARPLGTVNNCGAGYTPWGTYVTCEENFNGYFRVSAGTYDDETRANLTRYGTGGDRFAWAEHDPRFVVTPADPNEPNRFGWVVEIDPFDPASTPVKRTALGRLKHEAAAVHVTKGQRVVVYMGDDQQNEYAYKFVSSGNWKSLRARGLSPFDEGTLYVARFHDDGTGEWLPLVHGEGPLLPGAGFADQGDVLVKTRLAATLLGATPMDRPEWASVDPRSGAVYLTLTNNTNPAKALGAANPRKPNVHGHVVRWYEQDDDHAATAFRWDLFTVAGQGRDSGDGSTVDREDAFGSPDGLWLDQDSRVWIQTDGTQPFGANDQMLAADPYTVDAEGRPEIRRFLTGVLGCEVTGVHSTPDQRTMFVNIQHPGEGSSGSTWPRLDGLTVPRSATVVVTKDDGGVIGS